MIKIIADVGINHQGEEAIAMLLIRVAKDAGCDIVKFQKRDPESCVKKELWDKPHNTPWGVMPYIDYRKKIELAEDTYKRLSQRCKTLDIEFMASAWDLPSFHFLEMLGVRKHKIASAMLGHTALLSATAMTKKHTYISTGMSYGNEIDNTVAIFENNRCPYTLMSCNSAYPTENKDINLKKIENIARRYPNSIGVGYSGHERGLQISLAAAAMGACCIERHITLDRTMIGSDHAASLEKSGITKLVRDIRIIEEAMGNGKINPTPQEIVVRKKLRYYE